MMPWVMPFVDAIDFLMPPRKPVDPQFANKPVGRKTEGVAFSTRTEMDRTHIRP